MALQALPSESAAPAQAAGRDATLQHIALLRRKQDRLREAQVAAEHQFLHSVSVAYGAGELSPAELAITYREYATVAATGFHARWNHIVQIPAKKAQHLDRRVPNGPDGSWFGSYPIGTAPCPPHGDCVVYVLFDVAGEPCYIGSTQDFRNRVANHKISMNFERWVAYPCPDREAAYVLETTLLREHKPYRNKKRGR